VGLAIVLLAGLVHGVWTGRWQLTNEPQASAARLENVAMDLGDWQSRSLELDAQTLAIGEIAGYLDRVFRSQQTGEEVSTLIVCGRPGPIGQHPPDICYGGEGYELHKKKRQAFEVDGAKGPAEFWVGDFRKTENGLPVYLRIFWSWSPDGAWRAPDNPRVAFASYPDLSHLKVAARYPALYKLYIVHRLAREDETVEEDPSLKLMKVLLPELQRTLFQAGEGPGA
jgi:hypothetical protein